MYREEAGEYDREFIENYDEDLNATLIFVRFFCVFRVDILTQCVGRFVFCGDFHLYRSSPASTTA
jgi:hypothetical protein